MAVKKTDTAEKAEKSTGKKLVKIKLPKLRDGSDEEVFAAVNGETYKIKRGVEVEVPDYIAEVLKHSEQAQDEADDYISNSVKATD